MVADSVQGSNQQAGLVAGSVPGSYQQAGLKFSFVINEQAS